MNEENENRQNEEVKENFYEEKIKQQTPEKSNLLNVYIAVGVIFTILNLGIVLGASYLKPVIQNVFNTEKTEEKQKDFKFNDIAYKDVGTLEQDNNQDKPGVSGIVKNVTSSIVAITTKAIETNWMDREYSSEGEGSGIIFNITEDKIMIATNQHVIAKANAVNVTFIADKAVGAHLMGSDPETDLAVIYVNKKDVPTEVMAKLVTAKFGDSDKLEVGDEVIAIGNPLGIEFTNTVTKGIVSALNREITIGSRKYNLIQTDAAINPGNSGGALINYKGEVIGINSVKLIDSRVEGIGFAIPISIAKPIIEELVNSGNIKRPFLGISGTDITESLSELYELPIGVYVQRVIANSSADAAGLSKGDVILEVSGEKIKSMEQLTKLVKGYKVGEEVTIKYIKSMMEKKEVKVKLKDRRDFETVRDRF